MSILGFALVHNCSRLAACRHRGYRSWMEEGLFKGEGRKGMTLEVELEMTPQGLILRTKFKSATAKESIQALLRVYSEYLRQYRLAQEKGFHQ